MAGVMDFVDDLTKYAAEKKLNTTGMTIKILGLPAEQRDAVTKLIEKDPQGAANKVKKYLESDPDPGTPLQKRLDSLVADKNFVQKFQTVLNDPAPQAAPPPPTGGSPQRMADDGRGRVFTGRDPLGRNADFIVRTGGDAALAPLEEDAPYIEAPSTKIQAPSYNEWAASLPPVAPGQPVARMTIPDEKSILHTAPGFRDTVQSRFDGKDDNRATVILRDHAAAENKDSTLYSFMKELESRAQGGTGETAASRFATRLNDEMAGYSGGSIQKLAFEVSGMRADATGRPLRVETGTENEHAVYGPVPSGGVAAMKEILNILDKYPGLNDGAIQNAFAGSRGPGGIVDPTRLAESLRAKAWGEELAANGFEGVAPALAQQIRIDRLIDGATAADGVARPGVAAALHRDALERTGDENSFTGFLEALHQMPENKTAAKVEAGLYERLKTPADVERFTKGFNSIRLNEKTSAPDRLANGALKTIAANPAAEDARVGQLVNYIAEKADHFSKTPSPAPQGAAPADAATAPENRTAAALDPQIQPAADRIKEKLGVAPGSSLANDIDGTFTRLQPFLLKVKEAAPDAANPDPEALNGVMNDMARLYQANPGINLFANFNKAYDTTVANTPAVLKPMLDEFVTYVSKTGARLPEKPAPAPAPASPSAPDRSAIAAVSGELKQELGIKDDPQLKTSRDIDEFAERVMKAPELLKSLAQIRGMKPVKDADGKDVNPGMKQLKEELSKNPDLFEEMNKVIDRNPKTAKNIFAQFGMGKFDAGIKTFTDTVQANMMVDFMADIIGMISPQLGAKFRGWADGMRDRHPAIDSMMGKMAAKMFEGDKPAVAAPGTGAPSPAAVVTPQTEKTAAPSKTALEQEAYDKALQAQIVKSEADRLEQEKRIQALNNDSSPAPQGTPVNGDVVSNGLPPLPNGLGNTAKVGNGTTASPIFARSAAGETPAPESPASRRDLSLEAAEQEAARRALLQQNI